MIVMVMVLLVPHDLVVMFFYARMAKAFGRALALAAFHQFVVLHRANNNIPTNDHVSADRVGMNIRCAIPPRAPPAGIVDENRALAPADAIGAPSPRMKHRTERHAEAEADPGADEEAWTRRHEHNRRIIVGHGNKLR